MNRDKKTPLLKFLEFGGKGNPKKSVNLLQSLLKTTTDKTLRSSIYLRLGWAYDQLAIFEKKDSKRNAFQKKALYYFKRAAQIFPAESYRGIGTVYHHRYNPAKAIKYYKKAHRIKPDVNAYYNSIGNVFQRIGLKENKYFYLKRAVACYQKAIKYSKSRNEKLIPLVNLAIVLKHMKKDSDAERYAREALKISKEIPNNSAIKKQIKSIIKGS